MNEGVILKINIAICDDDKIYIKFIIEEIEKYTNNINHQFGIFTFTSGKVLKSKIDNGFVLDILLLDINLKEDILGTSLGKELKKRNPDILLIYVSCSRDYYIDLAKAEPFDFLIKPIKYNELEHTLNKAINRLYYIKQNFLFSYKSNGITNNVDLKNVLYFESQHRVINIYTLDGNIHRFYYKLDTLEKEVEEQYPYFLRVNKSYYVNFKHMDTIKNSCVLINNLTISLSSKYKKNFFDKLYSLQKPY